MIFEKFYLSCLAQASYIVADGESGEAALVDPRRDVSIYEEYLTKHNLRLKYILETHLHADFVSGHSEMCQKTGARIVFGSKAQAKMPHIAASDGDTLKLGEHISIQVLETPGHTPESVCFLVWDERTPSEAKRLFSGDTLFVGDVGRPDLMGAKMPAEELGRMLYETVETKLKTLPDETVVYPGHGAGSACGKKIGNASYTTIGTEKSGNYAMRTSSLEEFLKLVTEDQPEAPRYFSMDAALNREGVGPVDDVVSKLKPMEPDEVEREMAAGAIVLDTRVDDDYMSGSIPGAVNVGLHGGFANWVGTILPASARIVILAEEGSEVESVVRCARVGYDTVVGCLKGGFAAWRAAGKPVWSRPRLSPEEFHGLVSAESGKYFLDVRTPAEREKSHIEGCEFLTLSRLEEEALQKLPPDREILLHCQSGYRSSIAIGLLYRLGFRNVRDLRGGFNAYAKADFPVRSSVSAG